jgi:endogenous inhibitor of DNA gyrase (YacG/DUF329 family)
MTATIKSTRGQVHCPICTHTVGAEVIPNGRKMKTVPEQKCPRCSSSLDAAIVLYVMPQAA